jgi:hypothetical protein
MTRTPLLFQIISKPGAGLFIYPAGRESRLSVEKAGSKIFRPFGKAVHSMLDTNARAAYKHT